VILILSLPFVVVFVDRLGNNRVADYDDDDEDNEVDMETAQEKKLRLAKKYLEDMKHQRKSIILMYIDTSSYLGIFHLFVCS
jgi:hypothetical protein